MKRNTQQQAQHFLRGLSFIAELIGHSNVGKNDTVLDIGAGSGAITSVLAERAAKVIAYEPEDEAVAMLRKNTREYNNVKVLQKDFLQAELPNGSYKVFSNIPFHLSSQIVRKLTTAKNPPTAVYLIVQKQFAQKLVQGGDHFHGALGSIIAPWWIARIRRPLRRTDFTPPPGVDTVLLEIKQRPAPLLDMAQQPAYEELVTACYATPSVYAKSGGPKGKRPSELPVEAWVELFSRPTIRSPRSRR